MSLLKMLASDNFIVVNKSLIKKIGLDAAVILGELASEYCYWIDHDGLVEGFFYSTVENIEDKTGLSSHSQRQAINKLVELKAIEVRKMGLPAKRYIRVNEQQVIDIFNDKSLKFLTTGDSNFERQEVEILNVNKNIENNNIEEEQSNKKERKHNSFDEIHDSVPVIKNKPALRETFIDFIKMRKLIKKPLTDRALKGIINDTVRLSLGDPKKMILILEQSIKGSWQGVYELHDYPTKNNIQNQQSINPYTELRNKLKQGGEL